MVRLFDYVAICSDSDDEIYIAQVEQIFRQYTAQNGRKRRVEYVRPFDIETNNVKVNFKVIHLERKSELELERTDNHSEVPCSNVLQKVTVTYQQDAQLYCLSAIDKLFLDTYFSQRMGQNNLADDGRQVMHQSIPSANIPPGFAPIFSLGPGDLYHLNCPGVGLIIKVPSCQLMLCEGTFQLQTDLPSIAAL